MYLISSNINDHVSIETVYDLEKAILHETSFKLKKAFPKIIAKIFLKNFRLINFLKLIPSNKKYFIVLMNIFMIKERGFPFLFFKAKQKVIYLFDVWEPLFPVIKNMLNEFKINIVFISAKQSADFLKNELLKTNVYWMPEGINIDDYKFVEYSQKNIDIIQMGRKYDFYHMGILKFCTESQIKYLFEKNKGEIIFKTKEEFIDGLSRSKISICFHSSTTNPERSGNTSTMTQRYLQSMASKCLIVGNLPYDMLHLFDYNPIIEADLKNPVKQLREILTNYSTYIPLIEKNYEEVKKNHQWKNRIKTFKNIIN